MVLIDYSDIDEFLMLDPRLIDFEEEEDEEEDEEERHDNLRSVSISTTLLLDTNLPNEIYYVKWPVLHY